MKRQIQQQLKLLEQERKIEILLACETGSRAWGFPSPDSDYDVRIIYRHEQDWYITLKNKKDSLEIMDGDLDITGWELKKALLLLYKSNASLMERLQSPIIYQKNDSFVEQANRLAKDCFSPIACMHHYLSMSKKFTELVTTQSDSRLKDYFYALRTTLCGHWIATKNEIPPIEFNKMFDLLPDGVYERISELLQLKSTQPESFTIPSDSLLNNWLEETTTSNQKVFQSLKGSNGKFESLETLFKTLIK